MQIISRGSVNLWMCREIISDRANAIGKVGRCDERDNFFEVAIRESDQQTFCRKLYVNAP